MKKINEDFVVHEELNPVLYTGDYLKPEVRDKLLETVVEFSKQLDDDFDFNILDILLVGSQAGYNYTINSDIDLHIVVNLSQISVCCPNIVQYLFNSEKARFNSNYDITVKGIPVEIYVEDINAGTHSNGIYSVMNNEWIKVPSKDVVSYDLSDEGVKTLNEMIDSINGAINSGNPNQIQDVINSLYMLRKYGLDSSGEGSDGNLVFKELRNRGLLDKLKSAYYEFKSNDLSLENMRITEC